MYKRGKAAEIDMMPLKIFQKRSCLYIRADGKKSGKADDDSAACVPAFHYAFRDYVSCRIAARFS